jgi:hypothetical protein
MLASLHRNMREVQMTNTQVRCGCGVVEVQLTGEPMSQYVCHCDDCQAVHGKAYCIALYPASAVVVTRGETRAVTLKTSPRTQCSRCGTYLFVEAPGYPYRGVNGDLLPPGVFNAEFHVQCRHAAARIPDELPHYKDRPAKFRGSGELMTWQDSDNASTVASSQPSAVK